jgi:hypothetical protein
MQNEEKQQSTAHARTDESDKNHLETSKVKIRGEHSNKYNVSSPGVKNEWNSRKHVSLLSTQFCVFVSAVKTSNSTQQSQMSEADSSSSTQEIAHI